MKYIKKIVKTLIDELNNIRKTQAKVVDKLFIKTLKDNLNIDENLPKADKTKKFTIKLDINDDDKLKVASKGDKDLYILQKQLAHSYTTILDTAIELNKKLDEPISDVSKIAVANAKKIIDVKEFELLYSYGKEAQKGFRGRINNALPFIQKSHGSKVQYLKADVEEWLNKSF